MLSSDEFSVEVGTVEEVLDRLFHGWPDRFSAAVLKRAYLIDRANPSAKLSTMVCPRRRLAASHTYDIIVLSHLPLLVVIKVEEAGQVKVYDFIRRDICDWSEVIDTPFEEFENTNTDPESPHRVFIASRMCGDIPGFPTIGYYVLEEQIRPWLYMNMLQTLEDHKDTPLSVHALAELLFTDLGFERDEFTAEKLLTIRLVIRALRDVHTTEIDDDACPTGGKWRAYLQEWMKVL
jgi:hypothetical protein